MDDRPRQGLLVDISTDPAFDAAKTFVDGLKVDKDGDLYAVGGAGLRIVSPQRLHLGTIRAAANGRFTNLAFGGDDGKTLFLTAPEGL